MYANSVRYGERKRNEIKASFLQGVVGQVSNLPHNPAND